MHLIRGQSRSVAQPGWKRLTAIGTLAYKARYAVTEFGLWCLGWLEDHGDSDSESPSAVWVAVARAGRREAVAPSRCVTDMPDLFLIREVPDALMLLYTCGIDLCCQLGNWAPIRSLFDLAPGASVSMTVMTIQAVVFDIGGVLEITPDLGVTEMWESRLGLASGELNKRMYDAWRGGSIGTISEDEVHQALIERLGFDEQQLADFMSDIWREYLGTANAELIDYARRLRLRYRTGIISNSFVGAREREQAAYGFEDLVDEIIYSHECGMSKPDPGIYALACERLQIDPAQMVFLDDSELCVAGARQAGIQAVLYQDNAQAFRDIENLLTR